MEQPDGENLFIEYQDEIYPSLSLLTALLYSPPEEGIGILLGDGIYIDKKHIPMNSQARLLVNYYGPEKTFPHYSFYDLLSGNLDPIIFKSKIVLIGATATGLYDQKATPFSPALPGVEKHANFIANILTEDFMVRGNYAYLIDLIIILFFGIILGIALPIMPVLWQSLLAIIMAGTHFFVVQYIFEKKGIWINTLLPLFEIATVYVAITIFKYFTEAKQKKFIQNAFGQYLSPDIIKDLVKDPDKLKLGGEQKVLTAFFSDVAGFSTFSEKLSPEELVELLNVYLTEMTDILMKYGGTVE